jgi:hypothetical protein
MLMGMQSTGASPAQMTGAMATMQEKIAAHQVVDHVEDNVETLLAKLET